MRVQVENIHINPRFFSMGPFRDEATVKITVEDVDEPPVFQRGSYVMEVKEDAARNTVIGSVSAADPDVKHSPVRYGTLLSKRWRSTFLERESGTGPKVLSDSTRAGLGGGG